MNSENYNAHPIQLEHLKVLELSIKVNPNIDQDIVAEPKGFSLTVGHSEYDGEEKKIGVKVSATVSSEDEKSPFDAKAEIMGVFSVDEERFPIEHIEDWAKKNAPFILYPYLREHIYSLTSRCGFDGMLLPLLELPTFKLIK